MSAQKENLLLNDILIVDDQPENLRVLSQILEKEGCKVRKAINGKLALKAANLNPPDLILLDISMPEMDGYEVCFQLKNNPETTDIPIIFISAFNEVFDKIKAFQAGGIDYITKPFQVEEVLARIKSQLTIQKQKKQLQLEIKEKEIKEQELKAEIIKRKETEEILYQSRALLQSVLNSSLDGIAAFQAIRQSLTGKIIDFRCLVANPIMAQILEEERENLIGQLIFKKIIRRLNNNLFNEFITLVETGKPLVKDIYYQTKKGEYWYHFIAVKLGDGFSITVRDITQRKKMELELEKTTKTDFLTNIGNRRQFNEIITQEWHHCQREQEPLSLILCDIDFFKRYNDYYGHQKGDDCLTKVAEAMRQSLKRSTDTLARYGGEEFAIILPNTPLKGALIVAEDIRKAIENLKIPHEKSKVVPYITISLGVTSMTPRPEYLLETLIKNADECLYLSKQNGRNTVSY